MKKLNDHIIERNQKVARMGEILTGAREAKRDRTDDENTEWKRLQGEVNKTNEEIGVLQEQERLDADAARNKPLEKPEKEAIKRYDLSRAIMALGTGGAVDGLEREMHQEAAKETQRLSGVVGNLYIPSFIIKRGYMNPAERVEAERANEETKTTGLAAGHIPLAVGDANFVVANPLYRELGCTVYENLAAGKLDLPFSKGHSVSTPAEQSAATQSVPTDTKGNLTAGRFQGWQNFTGEYLAESARMPQMMSDMLAAIDRGVGAAMILDAVAVNVMSGFATSDTAAALTYAIVLSMISNIESDQFVAEGFSMGKGVFYKLATTVKATNQSLIIDFMSGKNRGKLSGMDASGTAFLPVHDTNKHDIIYGDFKQAFIGFWGGAQLLVDPFTASNEGYTKITFGRMAAVDSNPYAFSSIRNVLIT